MGSVLGRLDHFGSCMHGLICFSKLTIPGTTSMLPTELSTESFSNTMVRTPFTNSHGIKLVLRCVTYFLTRALHSDIISS